MPPEALLEKQEYCALLPITDDGSIAGCKKLLESAGLEVSEWQEPGTYHCTVVYAEGAPESDAGLLPDVQLPLVLEAEAIDQFEVPGDYVGTPGGYAIHLRLKLTPDLAALQKAVYEAFSTQGLELSPHSVPESYHPHITLCYSATPLAEPIVIEPFKLTAHNVTVSGADYENIAMKTNTQPDATKVGAMLNKQNANDIASAVSTINSELDKLMQVLQRAGVDMSAMAGKGIDDAALDGLVPGGKLIASGNAVKMIGEGRVGGYLVLWGSPAQKDLQGEYFTPETDLGLNWYKGARPALYHHGLDGDLEATVIGEIDTLKTDDTGLWAEAQMDLRQRYVRAIQKLVDKGVIGWSSGSLPHLVKIATDGCIKRWPIVEGSLTPTPAEPRIVVSTLKAEHALALEESEQAKEAPRAATAEDVAQILSRLKVKGHINMDPKQIVASALDALLAAFGEGAPQLDDTQKQQIVAQVVSQLGEMASTMPATPEEAKAFGDQVAQTTIKAFAAFTHPRTAQNAAVDAIKAAMANAQPQSQFNGGVNGDNHQISVGEERKYEDLSLDDMVFGHEVVKSWAYGSRPSEGYLKTMAGRVERELGKQDSRFNHPSIKSLIKGIKANEIATSTASGGGDEWVGAAYSNRLWEKVRNVRIYQELIKKGMREEVVPQGFESIQIPTEGADPTVYTIAQSASLGSDNRPPVVVGTSRIGTGSATLTPGWLGMAVAYTTVLEEDSLIKVLPQYRKQMDEKAEETIEQLMINGDTATGANTNINLIDGTPGTGLATPYYIASNGMLKYPLVTNTAFSRDGGALDENDYRATLKLFATEFRTRFKNLAFIIDGDTHSASLDIAALKTDDVKRTNATLASGVLINMWGVDIFVSGFMPTANSSGKVPAAGAALGRILAVYAPYWAFGYKRKVTIETARLPLEQATVLVATLRLGFLARGAGASAVTYNLTV